MITAIREHEICMGHRVYGHESKCSSLHGHNYKFVIHAKAKQGLDSVGRVVDFSEIKSVLCEWLETEWDHKTILYNADPVCEQLTYISSTDSGSGFNIVPVVFNPTAENIANHFLNIICPSLTYYLNWYVDRIVLWETGKCYVEVLLSNWQQETISRIHIKGNDIDNLPF
jgi:6-pyruvoyltetrahydropterin/6-carboxytetrahydropterin synthase